MFHALLHENIMDTSIKINEDLLMNYYLFAAASKSVYDDWCPYHYIVRSTSASRAKLNRNKIYDPIRVKEIIRQNAGHELRDDAQRAYINTCINVYHSLMFAGIEYQDDQQKVYNILKKESGTFALLGKKREMMAKLIVSVPAVYKVIYGVYCRFLQKRVYS